MKTYSWSEIIEKIKEDGNINFIAEVMTPLHLLGVEAALLNLNKNGVECRGYILALEHGKTGMSVTDEMAHTSCYEGVELVKMTEDDRSRNGIWRFYSKLSRSEGEGILYYVSPFKPSYERLYDVAAIRGNRVKAIITDEGMGSYVRSPYKATRSISNGWTIKDHLRFFWSSVLHEKYYEKQLLKKDRLERFMLLKCSGGKLTTNKECAEAFLTLLKSEHVDDYSAFEDSVLICPSLLFESGIMTDRSDIEIYKTMQEQAVTPVKFLVKPHPREKDISAYEKLDCTIAEKINVSQESIIANLKKYPKCIIGESSSILVYARALFGIQTIAINRLLESDKLVDPHYFDEFDRIFGDVVFIPKTMDELMVRLNGILQGNGQASE